MSKKPEKLPSLEHPAEPEPEPAPPPKPEPEPVKERGDVWEEACPVCGLLGCRRHA